MTNALVYNVLELMIHGLCMIFDTCRINEVRINMICYISYMVHGRVYDAHTHTYTVLLT